MNENNAFTSIMKGLNQGVDFAKGNLSTVKRRKVQIAPLPDFDNKKIKSIRNNLNLSQTIFAAALGVSIKTVEAWESGKNKPNGSAVRILQLLEKDRNFLETYNIISI
jgi:putative transcriptional regulator